MKNKNIITTITFACLILVMSVVCIFNPAEAYSKSERRELASFPELNVSSLATGEFMKEFETYTTERFPYRDIFRGIKAFFATRIFQKDRYHFFTAGNDGITSHVCKRNHIEQEQHYEKIILS
jgi:hypothetical protein